MPDNPNDLYVTRKEWGADPLVSPRPKVGIKAKDFFFTHHAAINAPSRHLTCVNLVQAFQEQHIKKGWKDIGYNDLVCPHGYHFEGVGYERVGAHCPKYNRNGIGVCYIGNGDVMPTQAALDKIRELYNLYSYVRGKKLHKRAHRDARPTHCPGFLLAHWTHNYL